MIRGVNEKTKEQLLEEFAQHTSHNTLEGEQYTAAIIVKSAADIGTSANEIKKSVDEFRTSVVEIGKSSDRLSRRVFWLNVVLTVATLVGAIATVALIFK